MFGSPSSTKGITFAFTDPLREQEMNSGLLRFGSAPSSLLGELCEDFMAARPPSPETEPLFARFVAPNGRDRNKAAEQSGGFSSVSSQTLYHSQQLGMAENTYRAVSSNLMRQSSSPAGFLSHLNADSGYGNKNGGRISFSSSSRNSSLSQIFEMGSEGISRGVEISEENGNGHCFIPCCPVSSWEESLLSDSFSARDRKRAQDVVGLNQTETQNGQGLTHQFSLPKTSSEIAAIEKFLHFQDSVPCKIRAKRGCATHPRSIAERVRRTRISERMRKLQELVPNMDKQTNTADMLDLAVDYIKDLQRQVKSFSDSRASCTCSPSIQKHLQTQPS